MLALVFAMLFVAVASLPILGRTEFPSFGIARRMLTTGKFKRIIDAESRLAEFERALEHAPNLTECWTRLRAGSVEFGFNGLKLAVDGAVFEENAPASERLWQLRIPLNDERYVNFSRPFDPIEPMITGGFANAIERGLRAYLASQNMEAVRKPAAMESLAGRVEQQAHATSQAISSVAKAGIIKAAVANAGLANAGLANAGLANAGVAKAAAAKAGMASAGPR
jgi:hypothetical protein